MDGDKRALLYEWQFAIGENAVYGRTVSDFFNFLFSFLKPALNISSNRLLTIYVHNLPYDFDFIRKYVDWDDIFFLKNHEPLYARTDGFIFRDSLKLSGGRSLKVIGGEISKPLEKLSETYDYGRIRTPITPLSPEEIEYGFRDVIILTRYISDKIAQDGDITKIPMTNTGYVRRHMKDLTIGWRARGNRGYKELIKRLTLSESDFTLMRHVFRGGDVHGNAAYIRKKLYNIASWDFNSSYPARMVLDYFPMSRFQQVPSSDITSVKHFLSAYCCVFRIHATNVRAKHVYNRPLSYSKCVRSVSSVTVIDNGRVVEADVLETAFTELDFEIFADSYTWDELTFFDFRIAQRGHLPKAFIRGILDLYRDKTELKGVAGEELRYMISKNMLNAAYGMTVTNPVRDTIEYDESVIGGTRKVPANVAEAIDSYNNDTGRFLYYPWGVWVTAHSRYALNKAINAMGDYFVYSDTDSTKLLPGYDESYFTEYNKRNHERIKRTAKALKIPEKLFHPVSHGKEHWIGDWAYEGIYKEFATLGAKRYMVKYESGQYGLTVSGVNKTSTCEYIVNNFPDPVARFAEGDLLIPEEAAKRNYMSIIEEDVEGDVTDYLGNMYHYNIKSGRHMAPESYKLEVGSDFLRYLNSMEEQTDVSYD